MIIPPFTNPYTTPHPDLHDAGHGAPRLRPYLPTQRFAAEPAARSFGFPDEPLEERRGNWRDVSDAPLSSVTKAGSQSGGLSGFPPILTTGNGAVNKSC